ncbi:tRNA (adenosine(37)-N6)-threonylcarbamoyltransferase complex ATPase subunit type 1 TsaE [bacterium]|nr:tRNA (adenosine(37)-N6)-threonylcarbamoyltransferase complex ATPase subunit type 1 TsaE [bacterium]
MTRLRLHTSSMDEPSLTAWASSFAHTLLPGDVVALEGTLGAGKTALARAIIRSRMHDETLAVASPTFNLVQHYPHAEGDIYHADLHRLKHPSELEELGLDAALDKAICLIEWPEIAEHWLPERHLHLALSIPPATPLQRRITLTCDAADAPRMKELPWSH